MRPKSSNTEEETKIFFPINFIFNNKIKDLMKPFSCVTDIYTFIKNFPCTDLQPKAVIPKEKEIKQLSLLPNTIVSSWKALLYKWLGISSVLPVWGKPFDFIVVAAMSLSATKILSTKVQVNVRLKIKSKRIIVD